MPYVRADRPRAGDGVHRRRDRARPRAGGGERRRRGRVTDAARSTAAAPTARWRWCCISRARRRSTRASRRSTRGTPPACARSASSGAGPAPSATACPSASPPRRTPAPGLTDAGRALVRRCAELGIVVDVSHLNAAGFADVARLGAAPSSRRTRAAMRCAPRRATSPTSSCARSAPATGSSGSSSPPPSCAPTAPTMPTRRSSRSSPTCAMPRRSPASTTWAWARTSTARRCPPRWATSPRLPRLLEALRDDGFSADEVQRIAWGNWRRVLGGGLGAGLGAPTPRAASRTRRCRPRPRARRRAGAACPRA